MNALIKALRESEYNTAVLDFGSTLLSIDGSLLDGKYVVSFGRHTDLVYVGTFTQDELLKHQLIVDELDNDDWYSVNEAES